MCSCWCNARNDTRLRARRHAARGRATVDRNTVASARHGATGIRLMRPPLVTPDRALLVGIGRDETCVDREAVAADQAFGKAALDRRLEQVPQNVALAEAAVPVEREGGVVRYLAIKPEATGVIATAQVTSESFR